MLRQGIGFDTHAISSALVPACVVVVLVSTTTAQRPASHPDRRSHRVPE